MGDAKQASGGCSDKTVTLSADVGFPPKLATSGAVAGNDPKLTLVPPFLSLRLFEVGAPSGSEKQPKTCGCQPYGRESEHDDKRVVEAGTLRIVHRVKHPEEIPQTPAVVPALEQVARRSRHVVAAVPRIFEVHAPDRELMLAYRKGEPI